MVYDPAWDMPQQNWVQQGSFEGGAVPPVTEPDAGTQIYLGPLAQEWMPYICGALDQLRNPSSWVVADDTAMYNTLRRVDTLLGLICAGRPDCVATMTRLNNCVLQTSTDGGSTWSDVPGWADNFAACVRDAIPAPPPIIVPSPIEQNACNLAGFIAQELVEQALAKAVAEYGASVTYVDFALWAASNTFAVALPYAYAFSEGVFNAWKALTAGNIADFRAAISDPVLIADITCAIFNAIRLDEQITDANWAVAVANICAISYSPADIIPVICAMATTWGSVNARALQSIGAFDTIDCSNCGQWCYSWDFTASSGGWSVTPGGLTVQGSWVSGVGWQSGIEVLFCPGDPFNSIEIHLNFPRAAVINEIAAKITSPVAAGTNSCYGTAREYSLLLSGTAVGVYSESLGIIGPCANQGGPIGAVTADEVRIGWLTEGVGPPDVICSFLLKGVGVNPFGATNCS